MGMRVFLAAAAVLLTSIAFAEYAISSDAEPTPSAASSLRAESSVEAGAGPVATHGAMVLPSKLELHLIETGAREVCDIFNFGGGDVRIECKTETLPVRAENAALRGICITRYGNRTCY